MPQIQAVSQQAWVFVIRNSQGKFIVTAIKPTKCFDKVDCVEAEATKFEARSR